MNNLRSHGYKRYLEPESEEEIPLTTWYRHKKKRNKQVKTVTLKKKK